MSGVKCVFYMILYGITVQLKGRERNSIDILDIDRSVGGNKKLMLISGPNSH